MKSGVEHWISAEKAKEIADIIVKQQKHSFIRVAELGGRVINTAEIEDGPCTVEQMEERIRVKNKEYKCVQGKWHARGERCMCASEQAKKREEIKKKAERDEDMKPLTPEQREKNMKALADNRKILEDKGILVKKVSVEKYIL